MCHDIAHYQACRLGGHGDGLRALLKAVEAAGVATGGREDNAGADCLGGGLEERNHLSDLAAEFAVVVVLRH